MLVIVYHEDFRCWTHKLMGSAALSSSKSSIKATGNLRAILHVMTQSRSLVKGLSLAKFEPIIPTSHSLVLCVNDSMIISHT